MEPSDTAQHHSTENVIHTDRIALRLDLANEFRKLSGQNSSRAQEPDGQLS